MYMWRCILHNVYLHQYNETKSIKSGALLLKLQSIPSAIYPHYTEPFWCKYKASDDG